ncbi:MAG: RES family NAD+ phosphorylase [Myxococcales bacterium]
MVEAQFRNSTRKLVDSDAEQAALEALLDERAKLPVPAEFAGLHYLLSTPFRHPPLPHGSRFGARHERGILYGARELPTAFAEVAYYRLLFLEGTAADLGLVTVELTAFSFGVAAKRGVDLTRAPFSRHQPEISSRTSYAASQRLGAQMRTDGASCCLYSSARQPGGTCVAVFDDVFKPRRPFGEERWTCAATRARVEFSAASLLRDPLRHAYDRGQFQVRGRLPAPAA